MKQAAACLKCVPRQLIRPPVHVDLNLELAAGTGPADVINSALALRHDWHLSMLRIASGVLRIMT